jgi:hypothetical protein
VGVCERVLRRDNTPPAAMFNGANLKRYALIGRDSIFSAAIGH